MSHDHGWQPIETAPNNSRDVLLYCEDTNEQFVGFKRTDNLYQFAFHNGQQILCIPTHWMPLPPPPTPSEP